MTKPLLTQQVHAQVALLQLHAQTSSLTQLHVQNHAQIAFMQNIFSYINFMLFKSKFKSQHAKHQLHAQIALRLNLSYD